MTNPEGSQGSRPFDRVSTRGELAAVLGVSTRTLNFYVYGLRASRKYKIQNISKRSGGTRQISAPIPPLKELQRTAAALISDYYKPRQCVNGYVDGRGIRENAQRHVGKRWILRVDLQDFFPSIHYGRVRGIFLNAPFNLPEDLANTLAALCTHHGTLPQGAPTSPVISNLICRGIDHELARIARQHKCSYSRYCDDLVFSTKRRNFPEAIAYLEERDEDIPSEVSIGDELKAILARSGFKVNHKKLFLQPRHHRQMVTGLIVNERMNIPRDYVRGLRTILHCWRKFGEAAAAQWFFEHHYKRNRPGRENPDFKRVVQGRVQYVGAVRGWSDHVYQELAAQLHERDPDFIPKAHGTYDGELQVFTEGKTDRFHIRLALMWFQKQGQFTNLKLRFLESKAGDGSDALLKTCRSMSSAEHNVPLVFVFDGDEPKVAKEATNSTGGTKDWGNNVFSFVLEVPAHRGNASGVCIEMLYPDDVLRRSDENGRRLFLRSEFSDNGFHQDGTVVCVRLGRGLVVDNHVFDLSQREVSLSKVGFCDLVRETADIDYSAFRHVFERLAAIGFEHARLAREKAAQRRSPTFAQRIPRGTVRDEVIGSTDVSGTMGVG